MVRMKEKTSFLYRGIEAEVQGPALLSGFTSTEKVLFFSILQKIFSNTFFNFHLIIWAV
jgi:hypothetical protein